MNKEILKLAIPNIISNISVPLLSSVDTALMGRLDSAAYIGAVGLGSMIFNFIYWSFGFLRMGTTGLTAQAYGNNNPSNIINILGRATLFALGSAFLILVLQYPISEASIWLSGANAETENLVRKYVYIRIWAAPATLASYAVMGWFFGMQNAIIPLILTIVVNIVNIIANYVLVTHYGMTVDGVAWGTVIAQYVGMLVAILLFYQRYGYLLKNLSQKAIFEWQAFKQFMSLNRDIFIRTFCLIFAFGFFYNRSSSEGVLILAINQVFLQYVNWMSYGIDGFAYASESLVGKYLGAKQYNKLKQAIQLSFIWGGVMALLFTLGYFFAGRQLLYLFTNQTEVIKAALPYLWWIIIFPIFGFACYIWDGIFVGLTASTAMRNTMLWSLVFFLTSYVLSRPMGNNGLWLSLVVFMVVRGLLQTFWYQKYLVHKA